MYKRLGILLGSVIRVDGMGLSVIEIVYVISKISSPYLFFIKWIPSEMDITVSLGKECVVLSTTHAFAYSSITTLLKIPG